MGFDRGRPTIYTDELAKTICSRIAEGESLRSICSANYMPNRMTVYRWRDSNEDFCDMLTYARKCGADDIADQFQDISRDALSCKDNVEVTRLRLSMDAVERHGKYTYPNVFGNKQSVDHTSSDGTMSPVDTSKAVIDALTRKHADT